MFNQSDAEKTKEMDAKSRKAFILCNVVLCLASFAIAIKFAADWYHLHSLGNIIAIILFGIVTITLLGFLEVDTDETESGGKTIDELHEEHQAS